MSQTLVHLILRISYAYLIKFHDFADNSQEGIKHKNDGVKLRPKQGITLQITLISHRPIIKCTCPLLLGAK
jgi:hypothetical protein